MRVLFLSSVYPKPHAPTRGIYCRLQCEALAERHEVRIVSPTPWLEALGRGAMRNSNGTNRIAEVHPTYYFPPRVLMSRADRFMWASVRGVVRATVREFRPDCVLSYWGTPDGAVAVRAADWAGVACGVIVGGSDVLQITRSRRGARRVVRSLTSADAVFVVGRDLWEHTVRLGVDPARVHIYRQGIERRRFRPGDRAAARQRLGLPAHGNLLLWVGRMVPVKGLHVLVSACERLREGPRSTSGWCLPATARSARSVEADAARRGLRDRVSFVGELPHDALPDWYRAADLCVLSSYSEGVPNVLREALACGVPYVSTAVGGIPDLSDDPAVRLVPAGDPDALARAIAEVLADRRAPDSTGTDCPDWTEAGEELLRVLLEPPVPVSSHQEACS